MMKFKRIIDLKDILDNEDTIVLRSLKKILKKSTVMKEDQYIEYAGG